MKLKQILFLPVFLFMSSCTEDAVYSCDPNIDLWVNENIAEIQCMTRSQWLELDENLNMAAYRAFTPKQRILFWQERFDEIKILPWSEKEYKHIIAAEEFINNHLDYFYSDRLSDIQYDELNLFFYKWSKYAYEELLWDKKIVNAILSSGGKMINVKGDILTSQNMETKSIAVLTYSAEPTCNCNPDYFLACAPNADSECNIKKACHLETHSCGLFLLLDCNGLCDPI